MACGDPKKCKAGGCDECKRRVMAGIKAAAVRRRTRKGKG